jgi:alginate O-acetyltransferase complex protein AlgI
MLASIDFNRVISQFVYNPKQPLIFSSGFFLFLFATFLSVFYLIHKKHNLKLLFVTLFSLYFYYKSSGIYFLILIGSTVVDYNLANFIYRAKKKRVKKWLVVFSVVVNLTLLGYFKYTNFLYEIFCNISAHNFQPYSIFLPVGISFFTFQSLSYTIDIYRGELKPVKRILDYAFFVSFFPQLVAGPIVRAKDFIPQISRPTIVTQVMLGEGLFLILTGLFKKIVISDFIAANFVDRIFDNPTLYTSLENLFGVYGYTLQIYCDFSGYSDMAIGIALMFGYRLCLNFNEPYKAINITDFWRRWHISLSTWLKDYLYISLGGNRKGKIITYFNLFVTMLLGGLWHGASLRFILWGAMHGTALVIHKAYISVVKPSQSKLYTFFSWFITFHFVCFCWIFFRANSMAEAMAVLTQIFTSFNVSVFPQFVSGYTNVLWIMLLGYALHFTPQRMSAFCQEKLTNANLVLKAAVVVSVIILIIQVKSSDIQPFIYFQF